ncbi:hypothetical protein EV426DRAFT_687752 [Tirmania nivea]|nr:hypothetical protein EV426DRAFT_687752 [Tirmania nivea]
MGWASPVLGYSYFGGLVNLAEVLASQGWSVICPQVGPVSSNWERACELYAQLARGRSSCANVLPRSMDGTTHDVQVDYGVSLPGTNVFYSDPQPLHRQATCFNLPSTWRWSPSSPVHFIAHSQGGNTCRYLIHLLERGWSSEGSSHFTEPKLGWVKSLTTLATPHNGSSIIPVLDDLGDLEDVLLDKIICAACFMQQKDRTFDFCLDHRGLSPPPPPKDGEEEVDFLTYVAQMSAPDGPLTRWRQSTYNGFYDNSIVGVVGDLNKVVSRPSEEVYYFTLSFAATVEMPEVGLEMGDVLTSACTSALNSPQAPTTTSASTTASTRRFLLAFLTSIFGPTLQDLATFALSRLNSHLALLKSTHRGIPVLPLPIPTPFSTIPRLDLNPIFFPVAYPMCGYVLSPTEKELIAGAGGPISDALWREHDGVVPTVSMCGPFGEENVVISVGEIVGGDNVGMEGGGRGLKGKWVDLGRCGWWDHADCIGSCVNPVTVGEVVDLYGRIGRLLSVLPVDMSGGEK